ncbi:MAG: tRNA-dihydrouridine synthase family protein [Bacteroidales bacterium]|nr:tRNA-dihydrouridine synthase family protein [Bacteroidales bacterium]
MKIYLAPLQGYTEFLFRNSYLNHFKGLDLAIAPFIPSGIGDHVRHHRIKDLWKEHNRLLEIEPQILGKSAAEIIPIANYLYAYGYDTININMGCPIASIRAKYRGAGILAYPEMVEMLLEKLFIDLPNQISLKIRLGNESVEDIYQLIPVINHFPIKELIIHPRIGTQMYEGEVDLKTFEWCVEHAKAPLVYSGDLFDLNTYRNLQARFPTIDRWMIGRGLLFSPFLPEIIKRNDISWVEKEIHRFWDFYFELEDQVLTYRERPKNQLNKLKEYWRYFSQAFEDAEKMFFAISRTTNFSEYKTEIERIRDVGIWRAGLNEKESFQFIKTI